MDFNVADYKKFSDRVLDSTSHLTFRKLPLVDFWYPVREENPPLSERAIKILSSFPTTNLCEARFSSHA